MPVGTPAQVRRGLSWLSPFAALATASGCASAVRVPPPDVVERALRVSTYSATVRVELRGPDIRGRARALVGFERPDALRIELPGPTGPRLLAVARGGVLVAVFPAERAVFTAEATAPEMESLFGVALTPAELAGSAGGPRCRSPRKLRGVLGPLAAARGARVLHGRCASRW